MVSTVDSAANISQSGVTSAPAAGSRSIKVQVVDSCPAESAYNFCKGSSVNPNERCGDPNTNSLDISQKAYMDLTGGPYVPVSLLATSLVHKGGHIANKYLPVSIPQPEHHYLPNVLLIGVLSIRNGGLRGVNFTT